MGGLCPSAYRGVPGSPGCRRIVGDHLQVRKLVGRLLGQDPPGDLNLRRRQSDLLEKRRQRFQARWCSQEDRPDGILAAAERDRVFGRGEIDRGTGSAVVGGRAATFSCDGRMLADDCIPPDTSIRDFARSTG